MKKLYKIKENSMIFGVCSGLGEYFNIDPTFLRLIMIFICIFTAILPLTLGYLIAAFVIPNAPKNYTTKKKYKKFYRSKKDRKIAGICGGIAKITKLDSAFLRLLMIFLLFVTGILPLLLAYIIGWIVIPEKN